MCGGAGVGTGPLAPGRVNKCLYGQIHFLDVRLVKVPIVYVRVQVVSESDALGLLDGHGILPQIPRY